MEQKIELIDSPLLIDPQFKFLQADEAGGICLFIGTIRNKNQEKANALLNNIYAFVQIESLKGNFSVLIKISRLEILNEDIYLGLEDIGEISDLCMSPAGRQVIKSLQLDGFKVTVNYRGGQDIEFRINW
jgi:hypothetical protein